MSNQKIDIVIPVYKPGESFQKMIGKLMEQTVEPNHIYLLQTVEDENEKLVHSENEKISVHAIKKSEFDHGATRHFGTTLAQGDFVLFMTQDAMPADSHLLENLLACFAHSKTGIAYGRQLAREGADVVERLTRIHNYPEQSHMQSAADLKKMGIKTYFCSDVCAMYRLDLYRYLGGFVHPTIFNEDMIMASKVIGAGYQVAYCAEAKVYHSHTYTCMQQFHRNFDLGVSQRQYRTVFEGISSEKEGAGYAKSVIRFLLKRGKVFTCFYFCLQCAFKLLGYKLGKKYDHLPHGLVMKCTMSPSYFEDKE